MALKKKRIHDYFALLLLKGEERSSSSLLRGEGEKKSRKSMYGLFFVSNVSRSEKRVERFGRKKRKKGGKSILLSFFDLSSSSFSRKCVRRFYHSEPQLELWLCCDRQWQSATVSVEMVDGKGGGKGKKGVMCYLLCFCFCCYCYWLKQLFPGKFA